MSAAAHELDRIGPEDAEIPLHLFTVQTMIDGREPDLALDVVQGEYVRLRRDHPTSVVLDHLSLVANHLRIAAQAQAS